MNLDDYLPENLPSNPYGLKIKLDDDQSIIDALEAFKGPQKDNYLDDSNNILAVDAYSVINGGIDYLEDFVNDKTFFEPEHTYSVYPGTGLRRQNMQHPRHHEAINIMKALNWSDRDQSFNQLLGIVEKREDLDKDDLYYVTDIGAFDTDINIEQMGDSSMDEERISIPAESPFTIPMMRHEKVQAFNGYTVFLDWEDSKELDQLKLGEFYLEDWKP